ncbi:hypothetical protein HDU76_005990, partial [Blyttiomyces sp. JEL0837]
MISDQTKPAIVKKTVGATAARFDNVPLSIVTNPSTDAVAATAEPHTSDPSDESTPITSVVAKPSLPEPKRDISAAAEPVTLRSKPPSSFTLSGQPPSDASTTGPPGIAYHQAPAYQPAAGASTSAVSPTISNPPPVPGYQFIGNSSTVPPTPTSATTPSNSIGLTGTALTGLGTVTPLSSSSTSSSTNGGIIGMTGVMAQLTMNTTAIPNATTFTGPHGPTISWTSPILDELKIDPATLSETEKKAFRRCDHIIYTAVKERNQFWETARVAVADLTRQRDMCKRYMAIIRQIQPMVPPHVQLGIKMDLDEIAKIATMSDSAVLPPGAPTPTSGSTPLAAPSSAGAMPPPAARGATPTGVWNAAPQYQPQQQQLPSYTPAAPAAATIPTPITPVARESVEPFTSFKSKRAPGPSMSPELERRSKIPKEMNESSSRNSDAMDYQKTVPPMPKPMDNPQPHPISIRPEPRASGGMAREARDAPSSANTSAGSGNSAALAVGPLSRNAMSGGASSSSSSSAVGKHVEVEPGVAVAVAVGNSSRDSGSGVSGISGVSYPIVKSPPKTMWKFTHAKSEDAVCAMALSNPFKYLFIGCPGLVKIFDVSNPGPEAKMVSSFECGVGTNRDYLRSMKITPDGRTLLVGGESNCIFVCDIASSSPRVVARLPTPGVDTYSITISHDSRYALAGGSDNNINVWDIRERWPIRTLKGHKAAVTSCILGKDSKQVLSGSVDKTIRLWDFEKGVEIRTFPLRAQVFGLGLDAFGAMNSSGGGFVTAGLDDSIVQVGLNGMETRCITPVVTGCSWPTIS